MSDVRDVGVVFVDDGRDVIGVEKEEDVPFDERSFPEETKHYKIMLSLNDLQKTKYF